jgi:hypothetical protein
MEYINISSSAHLHRHICPTTQSNNQQEWPTMELPIVGSLLPFLTARLSAVGMGALLCSSQQGRDSNKVRRMCHQRAVLPANGSNDQCH